MPLELLAVMELVVDIYEPEELRLGGMIDLLDFLFWEEKGLLLIISYSAQCLLAVFHSTLVDANLLGTPPPFEVRSLS